MPSCEKCWSDAHADYPYCNVAETYDRLINERKDNPCTPEQQAGEFATHCPKCDRRAVHQYCHVCMACGWKQSSAAESGLGAE